MPVTLQTPFGVQCKPYGEARSAEFYARHNGTPFPSDCAVMHFISVLYTITDGWSGARERAKFDKRNSSKNVVWFQNNVGWFLKFGGNTNINRLLFADWSVSKI